MGPGAAESIRAAAVCIARRAVAPHTLCSSRASSVAWVVRVVEVAQSVSMFQAPVRVLPVCIVDASCSAATRLCRTPVYLCYLLRRQPLGQTPSQRPLGKAFATTKALFSSWTRLVVARPGIGRVLGARPDGIRPRYCYHVAGESLVGALKPSIGHGKGPSLTDFHFVSHHPRWIPDQIRRTHFCLDPSRCLLSTDSVNQSSPLGNRSGRNVCVGDSTLSCDESACFPRV